MEEEQILFSEEEQLLYDLEESYFFDSNLMMIPETLDQICHQFQIDVEITDSQQYQQERKKLLLHLLKYDIGCEILVKLIYRRNESPLDGYYYLKTLDDLTSILWEMQNELIEKIMQEGTIEIKIAERIDKLFHSILNRKLKEKTKLDKLELEKAEKELELLQGQQQRVSEISCFLFHFQYYQAQNQQIQQLLTLEQMSLLQKVILGKNENKKPSNDMYSVEDALKFISNLTIYQQELLLTYLNLYQDQEQEFQIRREFQNLYEAIYYTDTLKKENFEMNFREVVKKSTSFYQEIESWKFLIVEKLIQLDQQQDAYEILLASKIDWSTSENSDILINILIASNRIIQAYTYASEMKDVQIFRYFIIEMINNNQIEELLRINFQPEQDQLVNEIIKNLQNEQLLIEFTRKLLRTKKYFQAIEFYKMLDQDSLGIGKQKVKDLIKKRISQLSVVENNFYQAKLEQQQQIIADSELTVLILNYANVAEKSRGKDSNIKSMILKPKIDRKRVINCCGWIRENNIGTSF